MQVLFGCLIEEPNNESSCHTHIHIQRYYYLDAATDTDRDRDTDASSRLLEILGKLRKPFTLDSDIRLPVTANLLNHFCCLVFFFIFSLFFWLIFFCILCLAYKSTARRKKKVRKKEIYLPDCKIMQKGNELKKWKGLEELQ